MSKKENFRLQENFQKVQSELSIVFERVELMKNRSQLMFCVRVSQAAIQKQNCGIT
jgi:hypothetical protein